MSAVAQTFEHERVQAAEERSPANQGEAALGDVRRELGWCLLEHVPDRSADQVEWAGERDADGVAADARSSEQPSELCTTVVPIPYLYPAQEVATTTEEANKCTIGMAESLLFRDAKEPKK